MMKTVRFIFPLGIILLLTGCNTTTATATGILNKPIHYTYDDGYSPIQTRDPYPPTDVSQEPYSSDTNARYIYFDSSD